MKNQIKEQTNRILSLREAKKTVLNSADILQGEELDNAYYNALNALNKLINMEIDILNALEVKANEKVFQFYFHYTEGGAKQVVETKVCKSPGRTKVYKTLENNFNDGFIHSYGYEQVN